MSETLHKSHNVSVLMYHSVCLAKYKNAEETKSGHLTNAKEIKCFPLVTER